jgi:hypothetical protein
MNKKIHVWLVSLALCAISFEGLWRIPSVLDSLQTVPQHFVAISQIVYSIAGIGVVVGFWRSSRSTMTMVIIWGIASLAAAIGGPLTLSPATPTLHRPIIAIAVAVVIMTLGLLWYVHRITRAEIQPNAQPVCFCIIHVIAVL